MTNLDGRLNEILTSVTCRRVRIAIKNAMLELIDEIDRAAYRRGLVGGLMRRRRAAGDNPENKRDPSACSGRTQGAERQIM
jgi:hypothetical protein